MNGSVLLMAVVIENIVRNLIDLEIKERERRGEEKACMQLANCANET